MKKLILKVCLVTLMVVCFNCHVLFSEENNQTFDKYGGFTGIKGKQTGYFHTEKIKNRWWLITPEGNVFFSVGMYCVRISGIPETKTGKRAYQENCLKKYGGEAKWAKTAIKRLEDWGFNTIGDWSSKSVFSSQSLPYVISLGIGMKGKNIIPKGYYGFFPDVFDSSFKKGVERAIKSKINWYPKIINDPWLIGYFLADEPAWYGSKQRRGALVDDFIRLSHDSAGKKAWGNFLKQKYKGISKLNQVWQEKFKDFDEMLYLEKIKDTPLIKKDKLEFLGIIAEQFSKVAYEVVRKHDPNHLILGSRPTRDYPEVVKAVGKYTDIYGGGFSGLKSGYEINPNFDELVNSLYAVAKKPLLPGVIITSKESNLPYGMVKTQKDRGISYWRYLKKVASNPNIIGLNWFQYFDPPLKCYDKRPANWGLVNEKDEPYEEAVRLISQANKMVYAYVLGLSNFAPEFDSMFRLNKRETPKAQQCPLKKITIPVPNSGFEQGIRNWGLQAWKGGSKASIDASVKHAGKKSLKIQGGPDETWGSVGVGIRYEPNFILKSEYRYKLSVWIKTQNVEDSAFVRIKVKYRNGEDGYFKTPDMYGTEEWKCVEVEFSPRDDNTVEYLVAQLVGRGIVWFDDIRLEVIAPESISADEFVLEKTLETKVLSGRKLPLSNAGFEAGNKDWRFQAWKGSPKVKIDKHVAYSGKKSVRIKGTAGGWDSVGVVIRNNVGFSLSPDKRYRLSGWIKTEDVENDAFIRIKVKYEDGKTGYFSTSTLNETGNWEMVSKEFQPRARNEIVYLACQLVGKGIVWFDDLSLEVMEK